MIDALASMRSPAVLAVVGEGPMRAQLAALARSAGLDERIHLLGFRNDVADWVAAADIFCLSSVWEGVPLAAQEAILLGTPVVATDVGGMRELIANKVSGRLVPPGDESLLATALEEMLSDPERARAYAHEAVDRLRARFSTERMLARLKEAYVA
jgi:glycosyltransferase involved in cell wall biosynthesis